MENNDYSFKAIDFYPSCKVVKILVTSAPDFMFAIFSGADHGPFYCEVSFLTV